MSFVTFLSTFLFILSHSVSFEFLHFNVLVRYTDVMVINVDETDDEADYLLIAHAKTDCLVRLLDSSAALRRSYHSAQVLHELTFGMFTTLI